MFLFFFVVGIYTMFLSFFCSMLFFDLGGNEVTRHSPKRFEARTYSGQLKTEGVGVLMVTLYSLVVIASNVFARYTRYTLYDFNTLHGLISLVFWYSLAFC